MQHDMSTSDYSGASSSPVETDTETHETTLTSRRRVLKASWIVPAVVAFGSIPAMGASQSPGGPSTGEPPYRLPVEYEQ